MTSIITVLDDHDAKACLGRISYGMGTIDDVNLAAAELLRRGWSYNPKNGWHRVGKFGINWSLQQACDLELRGA